MQSLIDRGGLDDYTQAGFSAARTQTECAAGLAVLCALAAGGVDVERAGAAAQYREATKGGLILEQAGIARARETFANRKLAHKGALVLLASQ
jgi:hypothetical protein